MAKDSPTSSQKGGAAPSASQGAAAIPVPRGPQPAPPSTPHCRCGTPMHPEHVEKHRGLLLERYSCPRRAWWNFFLHPHSWMQPRDPITHHHE
jgi:hypothetical protein